MPHFNIPPKYTSAHHQILKWAVAAVSESVIYTVPQGRVFYLASASISMKHVIAADGYLRIKNAGGGEITRFLYGTVSANGQCNYSKSFPMPIWIPQNAFITVVSEGGQAWGSIEGWEQTYN